jgi:peptidoglycan/LPS O-acetylase OafA/YrhL
VRYLPPLDGVRGYGIFIMLAYHGGSKAIPGAFFMVSLFFTMSGYLITALLIDEHQRKGGISLKKFWERRIRRLMPAALLGIAMAMFLQWLFEVGSGPSLRGDLLGALGYSANWRFAVTNADYGSIFKAESPIQPFWSLAIEEQFYLAFPLLFLGLAVLARKRRSVLIGVFSIAAAACFLAGWQTVRVEESNTGLAYYATYTRAAEILVGILLAMVMATPWARRQIASKLGDRTGALAGWLAVAGLTWLVVTVEITDPTVFRGMIFLNTIFTSLLIVSALSNAPGFVARFFSWGAICNIGKLCYGLYVYHWPIFLLLDKERVGVDGVALFAVRLVATFAVATTSYHLIECPIRFNRVRFLNTGWRLTGGMVGGFAAVAAVIMFLPVHEPKMVDLGTHGQAHAELTKIPPTAGATPVANILLVGDSVPYSMIGGLKDWNENHADQQVNIDIYFAAACTLAEPAPMGFLGKIEQPTPGCLQFRDELPNVLADGDYDAVMMVIGQKDVTSRELDGTWRHIGDPVFDEWFAGQVDLFGDMLAQEGVPVMWASATHVRMYRGAAGDSPDTWSNYEDNEPERIDRLNEILGDRFGGRDGFHKLDFAGWLAGLPEGEFSSKYRLDGAHYTNEAATMLAEWAIPQVLDTIAP